MSAPIIPADQQADAEPPHMCDLCRVRKAVRSDDEAIPFCQECWDGWPMGWLVVRGETMTDLDKMAREILAGEYKKANATCNFCTEAWDVAIAATRSALLTAPQPAPTIDLERFRPAVEKAKGACHSQGFEDYCNGLLTMIDVQVKR